MVNDLELSQNESLNTFAKNVYDVFGRIIMKVHYTRGGSVGQSFGDPLIYSKLNKKKWVFTDRFYYSDEKIPEKNSTASRGSYISNANKGDGNPIAVSRIYKPNLSAPIIVNYSDNEGINYWTVKWEIQSKSNLSNENFKGDGYYSRTGLVYTKDEASGLQLMNIGINSGAYTGCPNFYQASSPVEDNIYTATIDSGGASEIYIRSFVVTEVGTLYSRAIFGSRG